MRGGRPPRRACLRNARRQGGMTASMSGARLGTGSRHPTTLRLLGESSSAGPSLKNPRRPASNGGLRAGRISLHRLLICARKAVFVHEKKKSMRGSPRPKPPTERRNREAHVTAAMRRSVYRKHGAVSEEWASGKLGGSGCNKQFEEQTERLQRSAGRSMPRCSCDALRVARTTRHSKSSVGSPRHNTGSGQIKHRVSKSRCQGESPAAVAGSLKGPKDLRRELNAKSFDKATRAGDMEKAD